MEVMRKKLLDYGAMTIERTVYGKENWKAKARYFLKDNDDLEILDQYNSEIRDSAIITALQQLGSCGFFWVHHAIQYVQNLCHQVPHQYAEKRLESCGLAKTLACASPTAKEETRPVCFTTMGLPGSLFCEMGLWTNIPNTVKHSAKTSLMKRLSAGQCELCDKTGL